MTLLDRFYAWLERPPQIPPARSVTASGPGLHGCTANRTGSPSESSQRPLVSNSSLDLDRCAELVERRDVYEHDGQHADA